MEALVPPLLFVNKKWVGISDWSFMLKVITVAFLSKEKNNQLNIHYCKKWN